MVAIEADSRAWHTLSADLQRDCTKANVLAKLGWRVLRFTWGDVRRRPQYVIATVAELLGVQVTSSVTWAPNVA